MKTLFLRGGPQTIGYLKTLGLPVMKDGDVEVGFAPESWFGGINTQKVCKYLASFLRSLDVTTRLSWGKWPAIDIFWTNQPVPEKFRNLIEYYAE